MKFFRGTVSLAHACAAMPLRAPISTLRIFEAAARRHSFHAAVMELNLTPSAVSHSIRKMEETLGVVLFERIGRGVSLSPEGEGLMRHTERAFEGHRQLGAGLGGEGQDG